MSKKYRVGIVGCGDSGQTFHLPACTAMENAEVAAICDIRPDRLHAMAAKYGIKKLYLDMDEMLSHGGLDIVTIATPHDTHKPLAEKALKAGCHVLLEKPVVTALPDLDGLIALEKKQNCKVMVHQNYRWMKTGSAVKKAIEDGLIGEPYWMEFNFFSYGVWGPFYDGLERLIIMDMFPHPVDLTRYWFGAEIEEVYAHIPRLSYYPMKGEGFANLMLKAAGDRSANIVGSWASKSGPLEQWIRGRIEGTGGCIKVRYDEEVEIYSLKLGARVLPVVQEENHLVEATKRMMTHFIECIEADRRPMSGLTENRGTIKVILAAYESSAKGQPVRL